jgi:DNA-binding IclR family transcriptional regulator
MLAELACSTEETAHLAAWRGGEIRMLAGVEGSRAVVPDIHIGSYAHAHARAAGKLLLALAPQARRDGYLALRPPTRLTAKTITSALRLQAELDRIRAAQYATDNEEVADGLLCLSVPILENGGRAARAQHRRPVAALACGAPVPASPSAEGRRRRHGGRRRGDATGSMSGGLR